MRYRGLKRGLSFLLCLALLLGVAGCGQSEEDKKFDAAVSAQKAANAEACSELEALQSSGPESSQAEAAGEEKQLSGELRVSLPLDDPAMERWASRFRKLHPEVKISFDYTAPDMNAIPRDYVERYVTTTLAELASGEAADIIDLSLVSFYKYGKSGLFEDFNELMEKDPEFDRVDYYTNIFEALESCDGKLYVMTAYTRFTGIIFNRYILHNMDVDADERFGSSVDYNDMIDLFWEAVDSGAIKAAPADPKETVPGGTYFAPQQNKYFFEGFCIPLFLDEKNGEAAFDSPEFIEYLEKTNALPFENTISQGFTYTGEAPMFTPRDYFCQQVSFVGTTYSQIYGNQLAGNTKPFLYKGRDGRAPFATGSSLAIPKGSDTELAWEFIKFMIREADFPEELDIQSDPDDIQNYSIPYGSGIPINRENCRKLYTAAFDAAVAEEIDGHAQAFNTRTGNSSELMGNLRDIFISYYDNHLISAEECARQLQERAWIYLNE